MNLSAHDSGTRAAKCWCKPVLRQACPECKNGEELAGVEAVIRVAHPIKCWRCDNHGLVEPYDDGVPTIILHAQGLRI